MIPKYRIWHKERKQIFDVFNINFEQEKIGNIHQNPELLEK